MNKRVSTILKRSKGQTQIMFPVSSVHKIKCTNTLNYCVCDLSSKRGFT